MMNIDEDIAIVSIVLSLIFVLAIVIIFDKSEYTQNLVGELCKIAISGYIGYLAGGRSK